MPSPQPVTRLTGTVLLARTVAPPPYTNGQGQEKTVTPYGEIAIQCDFSSFDGQVGEFPAVATVRCAADELSKFHQGDVVDVWLRQYSSVVKYQGRFSNIVVQQFAGFVDSPALAKAL